MMHMTSLYSVSDFVIIFGNTESLSYLLPIETVQKIL